MGGAQCPQQSANPGREANLTTAGRALAVPLAAGKGGMPGSEQPWGELSHRRGWRSWSWLPSDARAWPYFPVRILECILCQALFGAGAPLYQGCQRARKAEPLTLALLLLSLAHGDTMSSQPWWACLLQVFRGSNEWQMTQAEPIISQG